ncbi:MAG: hypothetical protein GVY14_05605 [Spirochaetes bacterium]|nr:hypothetical protein [Spirochaetota bacterium]
MTEPTASKTARAGCFPAAPAARSTLLLLLVLGMFVVLGTFGPAALHLEAQDINMDRIEAEEEFRFGVRAFHNGRYNDAILSFSRSLSFAPEVMDTRYWLGRAYYFAGFVDAALNQWEYIVDAGAGGAHLRSLLDIVNARQGVMPELYEPGEWAVMSELEGVQGESAVFRRPVSIEPRRDGGFYVTSFATQEVILLNANGVLEQRLRGGLAGFDQPFDVLHHDGVLFISEFGGDRVSKVNMRGNKMLTFGGQGTGDGNLLGPQYLATDGQRFIYVSDWGNGRICKYDFDGEFVQCFGASSQGDFSGLREPTGIAWLNGRLFVADASDGGLHVFDESGNHLRSISGLGLVSPEKMTVIEDGELLIADGPQLVRLDPEEEVLHEVSDVAGSSDRVTSGVIDANGNLLATDFDENKLYFLSRVPSLYSGLHVQIERVIADNFPEVYVDVAVEDRLGNPIVGLDETNFYLTEDGRQVGGPELIAAAHAIDRSQIALLLDKSRSMAEDREAMGEAATQLASAANASLRVVSAGVSPVLEAPAGSSTARVATAAASPEGFSPEWSFDRGLYFSATSLLDTREHRAIVFVTNGELGQGAFQNYGLQELAALLRNNHIRFYVVYVAQGQRDDALEYLSSQSGGESMFLYQDDGIRGIPDDVVDRPSGRYTLRVTSGSNTDFGRVYIPLEVEAYLIRRSGRDEAGYFGPREF